MPNIDVNDDLTSWLGLAPGVGKPLGRLMNAVYADSRLSLREREAARMRIAIANECSVCRNTRVEGALDEAFYENILEWRTWPDYSERERLAAEFAERFALDHVAMSADQDFWQRLRAAYSDSEIADLTACCVMWLGTGRAMRVLNVAQSCSITIPSETA